MQVSEGETGGRNKITYDFIASEFGETLKKILNGEVDEFHLVKIKHWRKVLWKQKTVSENVRAEIFVFNMNKMYLKYLSFSKICPSLPDTSAPVETEYPQFEM